MPFEPGQSGNPAGSQKSKRFFNALDRAIVQEDGKRLRDAADKLLDLAAAGEAFALQMLADRLDGKPAQQVQIQGDADNPLVTKIVREVAKPDAE
jgi:HPt (histidine-containing phosphotransfer) domain-containing protein